MADPRSSLLSNALRLRWGRILLAWGFVVSPVLALVGQVSAGRPAGWAGLLAAVTVQGGLLAMTWQPAGRAWLGRVLTASLLVSALHLHGLAWGHGAAQPVHSLQLIGMGVATAFLPVVFERRRLLWIYLGGVLLMGGACVVVPAGGWRALPLLGMESLVAVVMLLLHATHAWIVHRLRRSEARYELAAAGTSDGLWEWDLMQKRLVVTPQWKGVLGFGPDALGGDAPDLWLDRVHPDDKAGLLAALDAHIAGRTGTFEHEHRLMAKGGVWRWVLVRGQAEREGGRATWMAGWMTDLTGRREGPAAEERSLLLERATRAGGVGMAVLQADGGFSWVSGTLEELLSAWPDAATWWRAVAAHRPVPEGWRPETVLTFTPDFVDPAGVRRVFEVRMTTLPRQVAGAALSGRLLVVREITEQVLAEEELKALSSAHLQARDAALKANRAKDTFVANMSHELRTPLNAIIGYSEMLAEDARDSGDPLLEQDLDRIRSAGRQLLGLVNGILDLSRIEAGRLELVPGRFMLRPLLDEVVGSVQPLMDQNENLLDITVPRTAVEVVADRTKLRQVLINLVGNAAKFTERGTVAVTLEVLGGDGPGREHVRLTVTDTGIGMTESQLGQLFEEFWQAEAGPDRRFQGSGLGLAISRRFAEAMGGRIAVESKPGLGSRFSLELPRAQPGLGLTLTPVPAALLTSSQDPEDEVSVSVAFEPPREPLPVEQDELTDESSLVDDLSAVLGGVPLPAEE